ncbi:MAG: metallophosphoesterase family protein [Myxococcota bacterium]
MSVATAPMAFLSDIHGNLSALDAVLEELTREDIRKVYVAGDILLGGVDPLDVWKRLQSIGATCVRGVSDEALVTLDPKQLPVTNEEERKAVQQFAETRRALGDLIVERIRRLPERLRIPLVDGKELLLMHGAPSPQTDEITHEMSDDEILAALDDDPADVFIVGASHVAFERSVDDRTIVNVGSVGASPEGKMAHYAVVRPSMLGVDIQLRHAAY